MGAKSPEVKETPEQKELARIGKERLEFYTKNYMPLEREFISEVRGALPSMQRQARGIVNADNMQAFAPAQQQVEQALTTRGAKPGSGAFIGGTGGLASDRGSSRGQMMADVMQATRDQQQKNFSALTAQGQGQESIGLNALSGVANIANRQAMIDAEASRAARAAVGQAVGTGLGLAAGMYKKPAPERGSVDYFNEVTSKSPGLTTPIGGGNYGSPEGFYPPTTAIRGYQ